MINGAAITIQADGVSHVAEFRRATTQGTVWAFFGPVTDRRCEAGFSSPVPPSAGIPVESVNSYELLRMSIRPDRKRRPRNNLHSIRLAPAEKYCPSLQPLSQLDKSHRPERCFRP